MLVNANEGDLASGNLQWQDAAWPGTTFDTFQEVLDEIALLFSSSFNLISSRLSYPRCQIGIIWSNVIYPDSFSHLSWGFLLQTCIKWQSWSLHWAAMADRQPGMCPLRVWPHPGLAWAPLNFAAHKSSFDRVQNRPGNYSHFLTTNVVYTLPCFNIRVI